MPKSLNFNILLAPAKSGNPAVASSKDAYLNVFVHLFFQLFHVASCL